MYHLKSAAPMTGPPIALPDCMYRLKNQINLNKEDLTALEEGQTSLLNRLHDMRVSVETIASHRGICLSSTFQHTPASMCNGLPPAKSSSFAIHADPNHPPLSVFPLVELLRQQGHTVFLSAHAHSTLVPIPKFVDSMSSFIDKLCSAGGEVPRHKCEVVIDIIWKRMPEPGECHTVSSSFRQFPFIGEAILARLLCQNERLGIEELEVLDLIDIDLIHGSKKDQAAVLATIAEQPLCKRKKFDLVASMLWSALLQTGLHRSKTVPVSIQNWMSDCAKKSMLLDQLAKIYTQ